VIRTELRTRSLAVRCAILLIALCQVAAAIAPHTGALSGATGAKPHWHAAGDQLEVGHNETACPSCSGHHRSITTASEAHFIFVAPKRHARLHASQPKPARLLRRSPGLSRAPPSLA
jgi:hypothetical protein